MSEYIDILPSFEESLRDYLRNDPNLKGNVQERVYINNPNAGERIPMIIVSHVTGGETNDSPRDAIDVTYKIEVFAENEPLARKIAGFVHRALHKRKLPLPVNWFTYWIRGYNWFSKAESKGNVKLYKAGRFYEFRANETTSPNIMRT